MEIKHSSHEHPLIFIEGKKDDNDWEKIGVCKGCAAPIFLGSSLYTCKECEFSLHKTCAELPKELEHFKHPHTLVLHSKSPYHLTSSLCNSCNVEVVDNFIYHCAKCKFDLDMRCASPTEITIQHSSHKQHPLVLKQRPALLLCDACGLEHRGRFYVCNSCSFYIHEDCASFPSSIKHRDHDHDLNLSYSILKDLAHIPRLKCRICWKKLRTSFWMYYCRNCLYVAHLTCAMTRSEPFLSILLPRISWKPDPGKQIAENVEKDTVHLPPANEFVSVVGHLTSSKGEGLEGLTEINDLISHKHPLILVNESISGNGNSPLSNLPTCDVCFRSVSPPFYCCRECNLCVHEMCSKLPAKIQHPCHSKHPLILLPKNPDKFFGIYRCYMCQLRSNGICFYCQDCGVCLDVKCALLPKSIIHEAHPHHVLGLKQTDKARFFCCKGRGYGEFGYRCNTCDFGLHCRCVLYPSKTRDKYEKHELKLIYDPSEGNSDEYYCQICETRINQTFWFYHCAKCDNSLHIYCYPPKDHTSFCITGFPSLHFYSNLKFGVTYSFGGHHHTLTFVYHVEHSLCIVCRLTIYARRGLAFECSECNFLIHFDCLKEKFRQPPSYRPWVDWRSKAYPSRRIDCASEWLNE